MYECDGTQNRARLSGAPASQPFSHHKLCMCECVCRNGLVCVCIRHGNMFKGYVLYMCTVGILIQEQSD